VNIVAWQQAVSFFLRPLVRWPWESRSWPVSGRWRRGCSHFCCGHCLARRIHQLQSPGGQAPRLPRRRLTPRRSALLPARRRRCLPPPRRQPFRHADSHSHTVAFSDAHCYSHVVANACAGNGDSNADANPDPRGNGTCYIIGLRRCNSNTYGTTDTPGCNPT